MTLNALLKFVLSAAVTLGMQSVASAQANVAPVHTKANFNDTPEGVAVEGEVRNDRDTIIFVHGWSPMQDIGFMNNQQAWNRAGFNTAIFRWHFDSFNFGLTPGPAEGRGWSSACHKGYAGISKFIHDLGPDYTGDIRLVGHSLGAGVATCIMHRLYEGTEVVKPQRLELLDSFIQPGAKLPVGGEIAGFEAGDKLYDVVESLLDGLQKKGVAIVNYSSFLGGMTSRDLGKVVHFQQMSQYWLGANLPARHSEIVDAYFKSVDQTIPLMSEDGRMAFSARTPTSEIKNRPLQKSIQISGEKTTTFSDDVFSLVDE